MAFEFDLALEDAVLVTAFCVPASVVGLLVWRYDRRRRLLPYVPELAGSWAIAMLIGVAFAWALYFVS